MNTVTNIPFGTPKSKERNSHYRWRDSKTDNNVFRNSSYWQIPKTILPLKAMLQTELCIWKIKIYPFLAKFIFGSRYSRVDLVKLAKDRFYNALSVHLDDSLLADRLKNVVQIKCLPYTCYNNWVLSQT